MKMFKKLKKGVAVLTGMVMSVPAFAAVPAIFGTEIATLQTDALAVVDLAVPFVLAVLGIFVLLKIVKRAVKTA